MANPNNRGIVVLFVIAMRNYFLVFLDSYCTMRMHAPLEVSLALLALTIPMSAIYRQYEMRPTRNALFREEDGPNSQQIGLYGHLPILPGAVITQSITTRSRPALPRRNIPSRRARIVVVIDPLCCGLASFVDRMERIDRRHKLLLAICGHYAHG